MPEEFQLDIPVFETERLVVRRWAKADQPKVLALYSDRGVIRWVDDGRPLTRAEAESWMEVTQANYEKRGYGMFVIDDRMTLETVGFGGFVHPGGQLEPEVKYAFQRKVWGKGMATEFTRGLLNYGRTVHKLQRITATVAPENKASSRVLLKSGFRYLSRRTEEDGSHTEVYAFCPF